MTAKELTIKNTWNEITASLMELLAKNSDCIAVKAETALKLTKNTSESNIKLGGVYSYSALIGSIEYALYTKDGDYIGSCSGTCGKNCKGCFNPDDPKKSACYVQKSYTRYQSDNGFNSVINSHASKTMLMRKYKEFLAISFDKQLKSAKDKYPVRINQAGELETIQDFLFWIDRAKNNPYRKFWIYTKAYDYVIDLLNYGFVPENLIVNISIWHEQGVKEYNKVKHLNNVNAFVYLDGFNYEAYGLTITTYCYAYDINGKMNHDITCDKCGKCFRGGQIIGCYDH